MVYVEPRYRGIVPTPTSTSPNQSFKAEGSLFSPKVQNKYMVSPPAELIQKPLQVVNSASPSYKWSGMSAQPQGHVIMELLTGRMGVSTGPVLQSDVSKHYWTPSNSYNMVLEEKDSLKDLSSELEKLRLNKSNTSQGSRFGEAREGQPLAQSTPSCRPTYGRAPSPNCRATDVERDRQKAEQRLCDKMKTVLCTQYMKTGSCDYGKCCRFAHGYAELRLRKVPANYKTVLCQNFERDSYCRYGKRCQFIHRNYDHANSSDVDMDRAVLATSADEKKVMKPVVFGNRFQRSNFH
ncbi:unnamed protein product [Bursaphelenchus okinawaensis]|uniref:C3H1-type domain-containing protein n=1 Tax=Bursaphelenchus okinawaensis TaxID=465554 RepID=A0A811KRB8_9BILA|nr:unnamed protein product [Bursaphelenchus okinawaensis]CAG9109705.1 unnamed protein product [Bursaphelenchus okinawaensis]